MKCKEVVRIIEQDGWFWKRSSSSHRICRHPAKPGIVVVAYHGARDIPDGTLRSILKQAGLE